MGAAPAFDAFEMSPLTDGVRDLVVAVLLGG